jgi:hypothetical protein
VRVVAASGFCALLFLGPAIVFATSVEWTRVTTAELAVVLVLLGLSVAVLLMRLLDRSPQRGWRALAMTLATPCIVLGIGLALYSSGLLFSRGALDAMKSWPVVPPPPAADGALVRVDEVNAGDCLLTTSAPIWIRVPCSDPHTAEVQRAASLPTTELYTGGQIVSTAYTRACSGLQTVSGWTGSVWTRRSGDSTTYACIAHAT